MGLIQHRIPITESLKERILEIRADKDWRVFDATWWPASHTLAWKIANDKIETTTPEIYEAVGLRPPTILHVVLGEGSFVFGDTGLLDAELAEGLQILILESDRWRRHSLQCPVCEWLGIDAMAPKWHPSQLYCDKHGIHGRRGNAGEEFESWQKTRK